MGIRRRKRKLSTLVGRLDQRVRSVELRPFNLLTASEVAAAVEAGQVADRPDVLVSGSAPYEWTRIQDAYYYPKKLTGNNEDRVEIYLEADLDNLDVDGRLAVSGIHGTSTFDIDVDGDNFTVLHIDAVDGGGVWDNRASWKHDPTQDQIAGVTITNTYSFKPETLGPVTWTTRQRLQTKRAVDSFEITGTTVTLTMNANHKFEVGDIFYTNILSDQASNDESRVASGIDGLFYITNVTNNTIEYELVAGVDTPTGTITPTADVYVYPVARRWVQDGSIWVNNSDNTTYYWNGIRWVEYTPDATITQDDDPPSPPTGLTISSDILLPRNVVELSANWTAPTTSESGATLTDLVGHEIQWRASTLDQWKTERVPINLGSNYTFDAGQFAKETLYYFQVFAIDSGGNFSSTAATATHTTAGSSSVTNIGSIRPTEPNVEVYLGTFTITWDGQVEDTSNVIQTLPPGVSTLYVHASTSSTFTPSDATRVGTLAAGPNQKFVYAPDYYGRTFYFALEIEDLAGSGSLYSQIVTGTGAQSVDVQEIANIIAAANITPGTIVTGEDIIGLNITGNVIKGNEIHGNVIKANTLEADRIKAGAITAKLVDGEVITTNNSDSGSRIRLTKDYLEAYNNSTLNFRLYASNGHVYIGSSVQIGGYATSQDLSDVQNTADQAAADASSAVTTASGKLGPGQAAADVNAYRATTTINGNAITTGTIDADLLVSDMVLSSLIKLQDADVNLGRIELRGSGSNRGIVAFKNSGGGTANATFRLYTANGAAYLKDTYIDGDVTISGGQIVAGGTTISSGFVTGGVVRTSSSGTRAELDGTLNRLQFRNTNGTVTSYVYGGTSGVSIAPDLYDQGLVASGQGDRMVGSNQYSGLIYRSTSSSSSSDLRLKSDVEVTAIGLDLIDQLNPVTFTWKADDDKSLNIGLIAQEVESSVGSISEELVPVFIKPYEERTINGEPTKAIKYDSMIPVLINAVKELSRETKALREELELLKKEKDA